MEIARATVTMSDEMFPNCQCLRDCELLVEMKYHARRRPLEWLSQ